MSENTTKSEAGERMRLTQRIAHIALNSMRFTLRPLVLFMALAFVGLFGTLGIAYFFFALAALGIAMPVIVHLLETRQTSRQENEPHP